MANNRPVLFVDTCALGDKEFLRWLSAYTGLKKISVITYMEYLTFLLDNRKDEAYLDKLLRLAKIDVEYFTKDNATNAAYLMSGRPVGSRRCPRCEQINWGDTMIASQGRRFQAWIVTKNIADFPTDPGYNVKDTDAVMNELGGYYRIDR